MNGAIVPVAAIDKEGDFLPGENEVWLADELLIPPPAGDAVLPEQGDHSQFRRPIVFAPDPGHNLRALLPGEDIRHQRLR